MPFALVAAVGATSTPTLVALSAVYFALFFATYLALYRRVVGPTKARRSGVVSAAASD